VDPKTLPPIYFQAVDDKGNPVGPPVAKHLGDTVTLFPIPTASRTGGQSATPAVH
jgi:hypothetical protein